MFRSRLVQLRSSVLTSRVIRHFFYYHTTFWEQMLARSARWRLCSIMIII